jgi:hypothetical protein
MTAEMAFGGMSLDRTYESGTTTYGTLYADRLPYVVTACPSGLFLAFRIADVQIYTDIASPGHHNRYPCPLGRKSHPVIRLTVEERVRASWCRCLRRSSHGCLSKMPLKNHETSSAGSCSLLRIGGSRYLRQQMKWPGTKESRRCAPAQTGLSIVRRAQAARYQQMPFNAKVVLLLLYIVQRAVHQPITGRPLFFE